MVWRDGDHRVGGCDTAYLGVGGMQLYRAEMPGPLKDTKCARELRKRRKPCG